MFEQIVSQGLLVVAMGAGAVITASWLGIVLWTWRDMKARSRDGLAQIAATAVVVVLNIFGLVLYLMLRPRETLAEAYERSLEEEALLQSIEEKPACPGCGRPTQERWQVCPQCYTRLKRACIQCNEMLDLNWQICPYCATQQPKAADSRVGAKPRVRPTRQPDRPTEPLDSTVTEFVERDSG